jgi:glycosyltransferase involved in cell wall biosynthesis
MPAVSVIMNVWNGAATLHEAVSSVLSQTFADWELIVWDDCSTDTSAQIVKQFADPRIRYTLAAARVSLGEARQAAIQLACGEWLAFLDQDDVWMPRKLELQIALAASPAIGLIYGRTLAFGKGGEHDYDTFHEFSALPEGHILPELLGRGCFIAMSSAMLRRTAVSEGGAIPPDIRITPDYYLYASVCSRYSARAVQQVLCRYRVQSEGMTARYQRDSLEESLWIVERSWEQLTPEAFVRRTQRLQSALAVEDWREGKFSTGFARLFRAGSAIWLSGRPFAHLWRRLRRHLRTPYWMTHQ